MSGAIRPPDAIVERIRKLLALATSSNPHEAALAAAHALALAQRHNLDLAALPNSDTEIVEEAFDVGPGAAWRWLLMGAIARAHFCAALRTRAGGRSSGRMLLLGRRHDVAVCSFLYVYLARQIARLTEIGWHRAAFVYGEHVDARTWKGDFRRGAVAEIGERLAERARRFAEESAAANALVLRRESALEEALHRRYPDLRFTRLRVRVGDAYLTGRSSGRGIAISDALDQRSAGAVASTLGPG